MALTCVMYSPDFAQWKWGWPPGKITTLPGECAVSLFSSNSSPRPM
jgi:hypothetical protein